MQTGLLNIKGALGAGEFQLLLDRTIGDDIYTKLLLHFDGQNGGKEIIDSTSPGHVGTQNGVAALTSAQQKFGATSLYFNSADGSFVNFPNSTDWNLGAAGGGNDWTVDFWVNFRVAPVTPGLVGANFGASGWIIGYSTTGVDSINIYDGAADTHFGTWVPTPGTWYHVAVVRSGTTITCYINGYSIGTAPDGNYNNDGISLTLGASNTNGTNSLDGYLDEVRISKGIARWTANFTPPTAVYATDSYTVLLCHMETQDTSAYRANPTYVGTAQIQTSVYKVTGGNNGAALFNGSSAYISYPDSPDWSFGTGNFTVDFWARWSDTTGIQVMAGQNDGSGNYFWYCMKAADNKLRLRFYNNAEVGDYVTTAAPTITTNTWYHLAFVRNGAGALIFLDGASLALTTTTAFGDVGDIGGSLSIGNEQYSGGRYFFYGYLDEVRVSKGIARWTSGFTPQTTQYTTDSYTKLLCHYDLDFNDSSGTGYTVSVGAGAPKGIDWKLGGGALSLDGSTQYLTVPDSADWSFGAGDFTVDFWVRFNSLPSSGNSTQFIHQGDGLTNYYMWFYIYNSTGTYKLRAFHRDGGGGVNSIDLTWSTPVTNRWYHIAYVMNGSSFTIYVDGTSIGSLSESNTFGNYAGNLCIGAYKWNDDPGNGNYLNGYMDEIRISKGLARWTANFTPSTSEYSSDANTQLLLHCNHDFTDSGNTVHTVTALAGAGVTSLRRIGTGSALFNGSSSYLSVPDSDDWAFGAGDFTVDCWIKPLAIGTQLAIAGQIDSAGGSNTDLSFMLNVLADGTFRSSIYSGATPYHCQSTTVFTANIWYHVAQVRNGNTITNYINGVADGTKDVTGISANNSTKTLSVGRIGEYASLQFNGYIDEFRISKGIARWTTTFTPSSTAYTTDSYTKLLLHMDDDGPRDSSGLNKTVTNTGVDGAQRWMFGNGSAFFNGTSAYLTYPDSTDWTFGSGDFTIDLWVRFKSYGVCVFAGQWVNASNYWAFYVVDAGGGNYNLQFVETSGAVVHAQFNTTSPWAPSVNRWYHVAFVRNGSTAYMFVDGTSQAVTQVTAFGTLGDIAGDLVVGALNSASFVNGWIDEVRISKGTARWTSNFTVPSSAYTTDANTKLLLHMDETSYLDASGVNYPVTIAGTAEAATAKIGTGSARFNGTSAYISVPHSTDFDYSTGDFTIDMWVWFKSLASTVAFVSKTGGAGTGYHYFGFHSTNGAQWYVDNEPNADIIFSQGSTTGWTVNTWYHVAFVRNGTDCRIYRDGVSIASTTSSEPLNATTSALEVGRLFTGSYFNGYIDELRISKGIARWTSGFTPSTTEYATDSYTKLLLHLNTDVTDSSSLTVPKNPTNTNVLFLTPKWGTGACFFDGSTGYLSVPDGNDWYFGTGAFTIECWINFNTVQNSTIVSQKASDTNGRWNFYYNTGVLAIYSQSSGTYNVAFSCSWTPVAGTWYHIAVVRISATDETTHKIFINGVSQGLLLNIGAWTGSFGDFAAPIMIGGREDNTQYFNGWMNDLRISKGIARYKATFSTPYPGEFVTDSYTKLLLNFEGVTTDASTAGHPATVTSVLLEQPKIGTSSLFFNGTSSYCTVPDSPDWDCFASGDFTVDFWVRFNSVSTLQLFYAQWANSTHYTEVYWNPGSGNAGFEWRNLWSSNQSVIIYYSGWTPVVNTWYHVAIVRNGTATDCIKIYVNGSALAGVLSQGAWNYSDSGLAAALQIGGSTDGYLNGCMDEFRISKGIARWTSNFIPQTTVYTADYYTVLLLHGDTLDMTDVMGKVVTVVSGAKVNKTAKIGTGALLLNGTSDYLTIPDSTDWYFGSGDFTIDCWVRFNSVSASDAFFEQYQDNSHFSAFGWVQGTNVLRWYHINLSPDTYAYCSWTPTVNTWYHVAFVRNGSNALIFIDGVSQPVTLDGWIDVPDYAGTVRIGLYTDQSHYMNGSIDELRISKGIARWTAGFTPQVTPYTQDQYTVLLLHFDHADESNSGYDVTNTSTFTTNYKFGSDLLLLDGSTQYLTVPDSPDWQLGGDNGGYGNFTIDLWVKFNVLQNGVFVCQYVDGSHYWQFNYSNAGHYLYFSNANGSETVGITCPWYPVTNIWYHLACVRKGLANASSDWMFTINGVAQTLSLIAGAWNGVVTNFAASVLIGQEGSANYFAGCIDELRISNTARWTTNFVPSAAAYTADSSTKILLHFDGNVDDSGARGYVPTNTAASLSKYGYFGDSGLLLDGNSDYVSFPLISSYQFGNANFTVEAQIRLNSLSGYQYILNTYTSSNNGWNFYYDGTSSPTLLTFFGYNAGVAGISATWVPTTNRWYHVAAVRYGSSIYLYVDGVLIKSASITSGMTDSTNSLLTIGVYYNGVATYNYYFNGWIDEVRISHTARWTANFTPPTAPYTDDTQYPLTSLTVSGLDGDTDKEYLLVTRFIDGYNGTTNFLLRFNGDSGANYGEQRLTASGTSLTAARATTDTGIEICDASAADFVTQGTALIYAKSGFPRSVLVQDIHDTFGTSVNLIEVQGNVWNNTADNITSMSITASQVGGMGIGSQMLLFVRKVPTSGSGMMTGPLAPLSAAKGIGLVKIYETTLTAAASSITVSGLNGDTDEVYMIEMSRYAAIGNKTMYIRPNNDSGSNYGYQFMQGTSTTASAARNTSQTGLQFTSSNSAGMCLAKAYLFAKTDFIRTMVSEETDQISGTTVGYSVAFGTVWNNPHDNITSLVFAISDGTNDIGIGTNLRIYALRKAT